MGGTWNILSDHWQPRCEGAHPQASLCVELKSASLTLPCLFSGATCRALPCLYIMAFNCKLCHVSPQFLSRLFSGTSSFFLRLAFKSFALLAVSWKLSNSISQTCFGILGEILIVSPLKKRVGKKKRVDREEIRFHGQISLEKAIFGYVPPMFY